MHFKLVHGIFIAFILVLFTVAYSKSLVRKLYNKITITGLRCIENDKTFVKFAYCNLKPINRTMKMLFLRVVLYKTARTSMTQLVTWKRANGYKPFLINVTFDACSYLGRRNYPIVDWFYDVWKDYTNINHSCPYTSDMVVESLPLINIKFPSVLNSGDYRIDLKVGANGALVATVQIYVSIADLSIVK